MEKRLAEKEPGTRIIRYADDFVAISPDPERTQEIKTEISKFCKEMGLELHETKTAVVKTDWEGGECNSIKDREKPG